PVACFPTRRSSDLTPRRVLVVLNRNVILDREQQRQEPIRQRSNRGNRFVNRVVPCNAVLINVATRADNVTTVTANVDTFRKPTITVPQALNALRVRENEVLPTATCRVRACNEPLTGSLVHGLDRSAVFRVDVNHDNARRLARHDADVKLSASKLIEIVTRVVLRPAQVPIHSLRRPL